MRTSRAELEGTSAAEEGSLSGPAPATAGASPAFAAGSAIAAAATAEGWQVSRRSPVRWSHSLPHASIIFLAFAHAPLHVFGCCTCSHAPPYIPLQAQALICLVLQWDQAKKA
jgi:hypothetical protein